MDEVISKLDDDRISKIISSIKNLVEDEIAGDNVFVSEFISDDDYNYIKDYIHFLNTNEMPIRDNSVYAYPKALISLSSANISDIAYWSFCFGGVYALSDAFLSEKLSGVNSPNNVLSNEISLITGLHDKRNHNLTPDNYSKLNINLNTKLDELSRGLGRSRRWIGATKTDFYNYLSNNGFVIKNKSYIFKVVDSNSVESEIQNLIDFISNRRRR